MMSAMPGQSSTVRELTRVFVAETPEQVGQLKDLLDSKDWRGAASLVHKLKSRFGYFGMNELTAELGAWEALLRMGGESVDAYENTQRLSELNAMTERMVFEIHSLSAEIPSSKSSVDLPLRDKVILVAEDDEINALALELFVQELGGKVIRAVNGSEAVRLTLEKGPDLIIMDVHMPFYNGVEAIRDLRRRGVACPIVSLSASTKMNERQNCLDYGANVFIQKPVDREIINQVLLRHLLPGE